ncbi:hypothetical protein JZO70_13820 [Enterococcus sp. 669A]|uniref:Uncharacterized protein n=1 Tax=Candidatus Enterococcus moelleringii TaxID=2815325 RepID=A0ABS3LC92_9ENTE|nr:hypothetical protein [Enterococcus sp. 669A]MBO1307250.1 hypothetical protein [Enterococcus sp. 669A]
MIEKIAADVLLTQEDLRTGERLEVTVRGKTSIQNLKAEGAIALINSINGDQFDNNEDFKKIVAQLKEAVTDLETSKYRV